MKKDKRAAILQATLELVAERGFHGAPASEIASRAGVGIGTIYRYFENKDALIVGVMAELEGRITGILSGRGCLGDGTVRERFINIVRGIIVYNVENPLDFRFIEQFMNSPYGVEYRRDKIFGQPGPDGIAGALKRIFEDGVSQGDVKDLPVAILHALTFGPVTLAIRDHIMGLVRLDERLVEATVLACWDAVRR